MRLLPVDGNGKPSGKARDDKGHKIMTTTVLLWLLVAAELVLLVMVWRLKHRR